MMTAPEPTDEAARLATLKSLRVLDTDAEPVFDGLVECAAQLTGCPIALVSLVDEDRQWFKAARGLDVRQTPREVALCAHAILGEQLFEVPDAAADARFAGNPLVTGAPHVRFYAGQPLEVDGARIGTLCVIDDAPRRLGEAERAALAGLARAASYLLQQRRQQLRLIEAQARLLAFARASGDWFWETDAQHRYTWLSPEFEGATGLAAAQHLGRQPGESIGAAEGRDPLISALEARRGFRDLVLREEAPNGTRWIAFSAVPNAGADGRFAGHLGVARDITAQRALGAALVEARERVALAADGAGIGLVDADLAGGALIADARAREVLGLPADRAHLTLDDWLAAVHPEDRASIAARIERAHGQGIGFRADLRGSSGDRSRWCRLLARPHADGTGRASRLIGAVWDITAEREAESERRAREAAEHASRAKSDLLSRASHELRTPLNAIVGFSQLLELDRSAPLADGQRARVAHIRAAGDRLRVLVDDLLDLSSIESGHARLRWSEVDAAEAARGCLALIEPIASAHGLTPALDAGEERIMLRVDRDRFEQVLVNLLSNAIKYNRARGRVDVSIRRVDGSARLAVRDDGVGIAPADLARLFQPFSRIDQPGGKASGTGLGLVIARDLAQAMGGDIEVESAPGAGSTFTLVLPLDRGEARAPVIDPPVATLPQGEPGE